MGYGTTNKNTKVQKIRIIGLFVRYAVYWSCHSAYIHDFRFFVFCRCSVFYPQLSGLLHCHSGNRPIIPVLVNPCSVHDDVIKWNHFPGYWPFVRGIHRSPVNSPHKGQWREALMFSLTCPWMHGWVNNHEAGYLRRHPGHYDVIVTWINKLVIIP